MRYFACGLYGASASCFRRAALLDPNSLRWSYYLGLASERTGDRSPAIEALERAAAFEGGFEPALVRLAGILRESDLARAEDLYRQAARLSPRDAAAQFGLGQCARQAGRRDQAIDYFRRAIEIYPDYIIAHYALAMLLFARGDKEAAREHLRRRAVQIMPRHAGARHTLAFLLARGGDTAGAGAEWEETIRIAPGLADAYAGLAEVALKQRELSRAVRWAERACELTRHARSDYLAILASAYDAAGRHDDAAKIRRASAGPR